MCVVLVNGMVLVSLWFWLQCCCLQDRTLELDHMQSLETGWVLFRLQLNVYGERPYNTEAPFSLSSLVLAPILKKLKSCAAIGSTGLSLCIQSEVRHSTLTRTHNHSLCFGQTATFRVFIAVNDVMRQRHSYIKRLSSKTTNVSIN